MIPQARLMVFIYLFTMILFGASSCEETSIRYFQDIYTSSFYSDLPYDLSHPDTTFTLPSKLAEISGISHYDRGMLAAVQDERGIMFVLDAFSGVVIREIRFGRSGDYEGIERIDNRIAVVKSNGDILHFMIDEISNEEVVALEVNTDLKLKNDVEGIGFDLVRSQLLVACKGDGEVDGNDAKGKCVYPLSLETLEIGKDPVLCVRKDQIEQWIRNHYPDIDPKANFKPSAVSMSPLDSNIYVLGHAGKGLALFSPNGDFKAFYPLNPALFRQPEGICFGAQGALYISNEARGARATLHRFVLK